MEAPIGHTVSLGPSFSAYPPEELGTPKRMSPSGKALVGVLLMVASGACAVLLYVLWTEDPTNPGLWFQVLFTVFPGFVVLAFWFAYLDSFRTAAEARRAEAAWRTGRGRVTVGSGRVIDRSVSCDDSGTVGSFCVSVGLPDGAVVVAEWHGRSKWHGDVRERILQPQVPGIGSPAKVFRTAGALVVELIDPTVVNEAS